MHNSKLKRITVALCMALVPISVFAAGLGKLNVMSGLGEPLKADIELIAVTPEELSSITAAIASEEAYATQGIEKPASHNTIKVNIAKNASGAPILKLQSSQPISEPFLDMLIQVDWASGRLLREYTVLLDPPGYTGEADASTSTTQAPRVKSGEATPSGNMQNNSMSNDTMSNDATASTPITSKKSKKARKATKVEPIKVEPSEPIADAMPAGDATGGDYVTNRGDTLAKIARNMKPEGISLEQMLIGLYQSNPDAFQGNNINRLKVGQIIRPPSEEALSAISRKQASKVIKVQTANWNAYRNKLAGIVAESAPSDSEANTQSAGGKIKTAAEDKSMPSAAGAKDVVKLSAGDAAASKANSDNVKSLQDKVTALQEEATAREKSVKEAQDRTASLEKQIADMQKLLALKNGAMSDLQKQAEAQTAAEKAKIAEIKPVEAAPVKPETEKPVAKPMAEEKPVDAGTTKPLENAPVATEQAKPEPAVVVPTEAAKKPEAKPTVAPEPVAEQGIVDSVLANLSGILDIPLLLPAGGVLAALAGGWMYLRKKREKSLADFEQGIMTSGGLKANTVFGNTASASVDTGDTSFLTDFSQSSNGGMIDTNDVDPIAEAEVYMAYGRDAQAEEILKDAITKEPKRYELHLKLLEMYAASKNVSAFETISGELYTTLGAEDPTWAKVAEIGIKLEPSNPLYQANSHPTGGVGVGAAVAAGSSASAMVADLGGKLEANDFSDSPLAAEKDLDFSFDNDALTKGFAPTGAVKADEFNMDFDSAETKPEMFAAADVSDAKDSNVMDFDMGDFNMADLGSDEPSAVPSIEEPINTAVEDFGHTMPSLDIPTFAAPQFMPDILAEVASDKADELPNLNEIAAESFEFPQVDEAPAENVLDISGMSAEFAEAEASSIDDFNFDVPTITPETSAIGNNLGDVSTYDLSSINLDLNDSASGTEASFAAAGASEPIEVDTKLELVTAYIEMDDAEGAKELLAEVMKEGGASQRKRAEALLATLA